MADVAPSITTSGTTFAELLNGGVSSVLERLLLPSVNGTATSNPTAAVTWSATGGGTSGGALAAGTYYCNFTETNGIGETILSTESTQITVAAGDIPKISAFPALQTGNVARNIYLTPANGASGTEVRYATGVTASTFTFSVVAPANSFAVAAPTINTTGFAYVTTQGVEVNDVYRIVRSFKDGNFPGEYKNLAQLVDNFVRGEAMPFAAAIEKLRHFRTAIAILNQDLTDVATLIDANAGTLAPITTGIGGSMLKRTWP